MSFKTTQEILRALADGKKLRGDWFGKHEYVYASVNGIREEDGHPYEDTFVDPSAWSLYSEPKKKVKWYRAVVRETSGRPYASDHFYRDEAEARRLIGPRFITLLPEPIELDEYSDSTKGEE